MYKFAADLHFYVTGAVDENEIILATVLNGFFDAVSLLLRGVLEKRAAWGARRPTHTHSPPSSA